MSDYGFFKMLEEAKRKALANGIQANTIIFDEKFKMIKPFEVLMDPLNTVLCCPPTIVGLFPKFENIDVFGGDFLLFESKEVPVDMITRLKEENAEL